MGTSYENLGNYFEEKIPEEARHRTLNINQVLDSEFRVIDKTNKAVSAFKGLEDGTSQKRKTYRDWLIDSNVLYFPDNLGSKIAQVNQPRESHDIRPY